MTKLFYDKDADVGASRRTTCRDHRLRQPGSRARAESQGQRRRVVVGLREGSSSRDAGEGGGLAVATSTTRPSNRRVS